MTTAWPTPTRACSTLVSQGSFNSIERMDCSEILELLPFVVATDVSPITLSVSPLLVMVFHGMVGSCLDALPVPYFSLTSEYIFRNSGRRIAADAATIPVPGSAVAQIVALIEAAGLL